MPVYGRLEASHGILQIKGYRPRNYRVGSNQITLYPFQTWELLHHDNIICLIGQPGGRAAIPFRVLRKGVVLMSTYEELMVILTIGLLIVAILNLKNK